MGELLANYRKYLVFLARTQLHYQMQGKADPSDVAQEVCLAAHENIASFLGTTTQSWIEVKVKVNLPIALIYKIFGRIFWKRRSFFSVIFWKNAQTTHRL